MADFITGLGTSVSGIMTQLASVTTGLIDNELFQFGLAIMVVSILIAKVSGLVKKGRKGN